MRFFASAQPGFGPLLAEEIADAGATPSPRISDGRNDLVGFEVRGVPPELRTAEDVFAEVAALASSPGLPALAEALIDSAGLERALSAYGSAIRPLRGRETFRVIARVMSERDFLRTQLRDAVTERLAAVRPKWRPGDPADMEVWALGTTDGWRCGLRLTRRSGRADERPGSLRPSVAAAMVRLADGAARILDPFCGSGAILAAALADRRAAYGCDIDRGAIDIARANTPAGLALADATAPPFARGTFDAIVSNMPFGKQFTLDGSVERALESLGATLAPGACVVVLTARDASTPNAFAVERRLDVELHGQTATLWKLRVA